MGGLPGHREHAAQPDQVRRDWPLPRRRWPILTALALMVVAAGIGLRVASLPVRPLVIDTAAVAPGPVAVSPDGSTLYMASFSSLIPVSPRSCDGLLETFSTATGHSGWTIEIFDGGPQGMVMAPDGRTLYVLTCSGMVVPVSTATGQQGTPIRTGDKSAGGQGLGIAITPDGRTLFIAGKSLIPISTATGKPGAPISVAGSSPVISPDGRTLYLVTGGKAASTITPVDIASGARQQPVRLPGTVYDMTVAPDSRTLYVAGPWGIVPVTTATGTAGAFVETRYKTVAGMVITPDGRTLYAATWRDGTVLPISLRTGKAGPPVRVTRNGKLGCPTNLTLRHQSLYVTNAGPGCMDQFDGDLAVFPISG
jgi:DNA-binding beta-propeller fold protein YncE